MKQELVQQVGKNECTITVKKKGKFRREAEPPSCSFGL